MDVEEDAFRILTPHTSIYITQLAILRNCVQAGEVNSAWIRGFCKPKQAAAMPGSPLFLTRNKRESGSSPLVGSRIRLI